MVTNSRISYLEAKGKANLHKTKKEEQRAIKSIRVNNSLWWKFRAKCLGNEISASDMIEMLVKKYVEGRLYIW